MLENNLNELNIFALRDLARRTGVNSPTSKKKEQLIKEIKEIISGERLPHVAKTKQGRPPKTFGYNFANVFTLDSNDKNNDYAKQTFNQEVEETNPNKIITVAGWIELVNNNSALLWVEKDFYMENYFIPGEVLKDICLKMADRVVAEINSDEKIKVVKKIFSVNDVPVAQLDSKRNDYFAIAHNLPSRKLEFSEIGYNNLGLKIGENAYIYGGNNNDNTATIINMINTCKVNNKIYINVSVAEKNRIYLKDIEYAEKFVSGIIEETDFSRKIVFLAIERAKRILEEGEDVVLFVDDIASICGLEKEEMKLVKNLVSITKEGGKSGSITLVAVMPNENINQIEKLADRRLKIENKEIMSI